MILTLLPVTAGANNTSTTYVEVAGVTMTDGGYWLNDGQGGLTDEGASASNYNVAYRLGSGSNPVSTLTLNNAELSVVSHASSYYNYTACIWTRGGLIVESIGENTIDLTDTKITENNCAGIAIGEDYSWLTFQGDGDLTVKGGPATGNSYGLIAPFSVKMEGTGVLTFLGGECGSNGISAGIRSRATLDDLGAYIEPGPGTVIAGTKSGGAGSYGIYGKLAFPKFDRYLGRFTAYCGEAESAMALSIPPLYMPVGNVALAGSDDASGRNLEPYRT